MSRVLILHELLIVKVKKHLNWQDGIIKTHLIKLQPLNCILFLTLVKL